MNWPHWLIALVALQRIIELAISRRNTARLLQVGGQEFGAGHYPLIVILHVAWLATLWLVVDAAAPVSLPWLGIYLLLQLARVWVMTTLGGYWTTRIISLPGAPLIGHGPYRYCRHPNYMIVAGEIAVLPLVFGQWRVATAFSVLNALVLAWRIRIENAALDKRRGSLS
jgi:methyltransferase